jgi:hypothetical protein
MLLWCQQAGSAGFRQQLRLRWKHRTPFFRQQLQGVFRSRVEAGMIMLGFGPQPEVFEGAWSQTIVGVPGDHTAGPHQASCLKCEASNDHCGSPS